MRILHVIRTLNPAWGGPVEGVRNLTTQASRRGYGVEIVCADDPDSPWVTSSQVKAHGVGPGRLRKYGITTGLDLWLAANISRFDVVVVNGIWMYFGYAVYKAALRSGTPYFVFVHGALDPWFKQHYPLKHIKKSAYWKLFEHRVLRDAERVLFTTEEEMVLAERAFLPWNCRSEVTGYGIRRPDLPDTFDKAACIDSLTKTFPALANREFILFLARVHEKKGIDLLLRAFAAAQQWIPGRALVIAGPGDETILSDLRQLTLSLGIAGDVVWTGPLYGNSKWDVLRAAEVYALPSHQENFGISVVEALACGLPVLISDKVNIWREIQAANCGLVATDDLAGTTRLLQEWAGKTGVAKSQMRLAARSCFACHFDIAVTSDRFFDLLKPYAAVRSYNEELTATGLRS